MPRSRILVNLVLLRVLSLGVLSWELLSLGVLRLELLSLGFLLLLRLAGSPSLHRSCASGSLAAGGVLLSLEVLLELELELLRSSRVRVLPVPELLDLLVLLELELLRAFVLSLLLLVLPLEVWVALVLSLRVLVLSLLRLELPRGLGRTSFRSYSRFLVFLLR